MKYGAISYKISLLLYPLLAKLGLTRCIHYINGPETLPAPLSKEEEQEAFAKLETDAQSARETLIVHNLRLVVYIAKKFESTGIGVEDLISIGTIGLIKAVNTFCPKKNIKLAIRCTFNGRRCKKRNRRFFSSRAEYNNISFRSM